MPGYDRKGLPDCHGLLQEGSCGGTAGAQQWPDRRAARAARHAGCADRRGASSLPAAVSERPSRRRAQPAALVVRPAACSSCRAGLTGRLRSISGSGRPTARRCSSSRDRRRARSKPSSIARSRDDSRSRWACATAVRRSSRPCRSCVTGGRTGCCCSRCTRSTAGPTTASTYDEVFRQLSMLRFVPALRVVPPYYAHRGLCRGARRVGS